MNQNILLLSLLIILILGGGFILLNKPIKTTTISYDINNLLSRSVPLGNPNSPVKIVVFHDFQCIFCKKLYFETIKKIKEEYISKGLAVLYYKDFAILGEKSIKAALASRCAKDENKYWEYIDLLYEISKNEKGENTAVFTEENLLKIAEEIGLNKDKFKNCLENKKYLDEIQEDINSGINLGVRGTPYVLINNDKIEGAYPYSEFKKIIDKYLEFRK